MIQELYIAGQQVDLGQNTEVVLEYKSNLLGDISKIEGSHSYSITLPKTRKNLRILQDPGNPARKARTVRGYLNARYFRNGVDLFGDCRAVVMGVSEDKIDIALTMQGLKSLAAWSEAGKSIRDLFGTEAFIRWDYLAEYDRMVSDGIGTPASEPGVDLDLVGEAFPAPAVTLGSLFDSIISATGVQHYQMPADIKADLHRLAIPFTDIVSARQNAIVEASTVGTGTVTEPERDAVHLNFGDFVTDPSRVGWSTISEAFNIPEGADTFMMSFYAPMPAGTFKTTGKTYMRVMGKNGSTDIELYAQEIRVNSDGSAVLNYEWAQSIDVGGFARLWVEVSNVQPGTHSTYYQTPYPFLFRGQKGVKGDTLLIGRNLPDLKQLDVIKFICHFYGLAILPSGINGLNFVPYSVLEANKTTAQDWSDKLLGGDTEQLRGTVGFTLSDFAQRNIFKWTEEDTLEYTPAEGTLVVDDSTLRDERTVATFPFAASYTNRYPFLEAALNEDGTHKLSVKNLKPRIFRLLEDEEGNASLYFTGDLNLPTRIQEYYKEYQDIIHEPITQTVNCRLDERDLKNLDFSIPVYFRQFGHFYAIESVRTSSKTDVCEIKIIQI